MLGTITTGDVLTPPEESLLNGNDPANRVEFQSGIVATEIPAHSRLRFRWATNMDRDTSDDWAFGLDDVSVTLGIAGDANFDGKVELADFLALSDNFGKPGGWNEGDFVGDGEVGFPDFLLLSTNFGTTNASAAAVPEPNVLSMIAFALLGVLGLRRRA